MRRYTEPPRVAWTWEPVKPQRFVMFGTASEKLILTVCGIMVLILFVMGAK